MNFLSVNISIGLRRDIGKDGIYKWISSDGSVLEQGRHSHQRSTVRNNTPNAVKTA